MYKKNENLKNSKDNNGNHQINEFQVRIIEIMKLIELQMRITKFMKIIKFYKGIMKIMKILKYH